MVIVTYLLAITNINGNVIYFIIFRYNQIEKNSDIITLHSFCLVLQPPVQRESIAPKQFMHRNYNRYFSVIV